MRVDDFDFDLPPDRVALRPAEPRDSARLLVVTPRGLADHVVRDLPRLLKPGDVLVFNDTRVIPAQLFTLKGRAQIGVTLHRRLGPAEWLAFVRGARRLAPGDRLEFAPGLVGEVVEKRSGGEVRWRFLCEGSLDAALERVGQMPLPPYIARRRAADARDRADYQTVYAARDGSVAAPTAGLHFTERLLAELDAAGIQRETVTLHVGAGTFLPVKAERTEDHRMHAEWGEVRPEVAARLRQARAEGRRILAVGTTSLRLLEASGLAPFTGETDLFITPGYRFRAVDGLMTNFHLPRSTLFMLVAALMGLDRMKAAYAHAVAQGYRFLSYGDSSLLLPRG
ncbi:MAG: tRNA preQ1(34) S-adenosylmethionine ribosyltransferase-isomerase QueA [Sphingomonadaceae bacterium]|uniref:tRNA preQ1(34) S-adenosylmethionine ribosyltransferase-isomerase QueA n=1 Tax=Thermaurantiacus sp. TaxID=2820283 RepID=UPI00298F085C|nr:tRNA preQ1(34) S-adenosylmethionine ribosyltransferase-isomerase QueA [Thermaurantiacus sp.]MCS6987539.1 tRNA preQ1(34) S-adenosylmethionine ribosyltransferase-isomerase QueA [Sphingomonadaceae bacterium]MDW8415140.1 tRNA preQ1(34) S-adenosylmethionine ribosyltransferase-isomerase QueA [Thermaurantiacus sp.]